MAYNSWLIPGGETVKRRGYLQGCFGAYVRVYPREDGYGCGSRIVYGG